MANKTIKETIRAMMKDKKAIKPSEPIDPMMIDDAEEVTQSSLMDDFAAERKEKTGEEDGGDGVSFDDFEQNKLVSNQEPQGAKDDGKLAEGTDDEAPPATEPEPVASDKGTGTEGEAVQPGPSTEPAANEPAGTWKVKTAYGEEEVDFKKLRSGYMMQRHYTQLTQMLRDKERRIADMLSNPEKLVRFAIKNGVDLKPLVHVESESNEIKLDPLPDYASDEQKQQHKLMQMLVDDRNRARREIEELKGTFKQKSNDEEWREAEEAFDKERGEDVPSGAKFLAVLLLREGQRQHGEKGYGMRNALADIRMVLRAAQVNAWNTPEGKKYAEQIERQAVEKYLKTKKQHEEETISADSLPPSRMPVPEEKVKKFKNVREAAEAAKKAFGIK